MESESIPATGNQSPAQVDTIRRLNDAFNAHDVDAIMALMSADCVFENTFPPPDGERYVGQAAVRAFWENFFNESPQARFEIEEIIATAERAVLRWTYHWVDAQGNPGHIRGVDILHFEDEKISAKLSYVKG